MVATANIPLHHVRGEQSECPMVGSDIIYEGAMLGISGGYARPLTAGDPFIGHAAEFFDNSSGSSGAHNILLYRGRYRLQVTLASVASTSVGARVFASADDTLTLTPGANSQVGVVTRYVTTNTAIVEFQTHEVSTMLSDLTALLSNLVTVSSTSDFTSLQSDTVTLKSDNVVNKSNIVARQSDHTWVRSDIVAEKSDTVVFKSDIVTLKSDKTYIGSDVTALNSDNVVNKSNIVARQSDHTWVRSDIVAEKSDTVIFKANRTKVLKGVSDAILAAAAGDYVNVSDIKVSLAETLKAFSDGLI